MRCQSAWAIASTVALTFLMFLTPIEYCQPAFSSSSKTLVFPKPGVGPQQLHAASAGAVDAGDQLLAEALDPLLCVGRSLAQADVQRLPGVGARGQQRVVPVELGVAVGGALLVVAADLTDEAVDVDHQPAVARAGAGLPGPLDRPAQQRVELADVPERQRAQERAERRWRGDPAAQQPARPARPQHAGVVDAVGPEHHREQQRHDLTSRVRRPGPVAPQAHQPASQRLDPQALRDRRDKHHACLTNQPLIVEPDPQPVQSDRLVILHHEGDLPLQAPAAPISRKNPAQEVILHSGPDRTPLPIGGSGIRKQERLPGTSGDLGELHR